MRKTTKTLLTILGMTAAGAGGYYLNEYLPIPKEGEPIYIINNETYYRETVDTNGMYRVEQRSVREMPYSLLLQQRQQQARPKGKLM